MFSIRPLKCRGKESPLQHRFLPIFKAIYMPVKTPSAIGIKNPMKPTIYFKDDRRKKPTGQLQKRLNKGISVSHCFSKNTSKQNSLHPSRNPSPNTLAEHSCNHLNSIQLSSQHKIKTRKHNISKKITRNSLCLAHD